MNKNIRHPTYLVATVILAIFLVFSLPTIYEKGEELGSAIRTHFFEKRG
jgi:hypothetical protein